MGKYELLREFKSMHYIDEHITSLLSLINANYKHCYQLNCCLNLLCPRPDQNFYYHIETDCYLLNTGTLIRYHSHSRLPNLLSHVVIACVPDWDDNWRLGNIILSSSFVGTNRPRDCSRPATQMKETGNEENTVRFLFRIAGLGGSEVYLLI